MRKLGLHGLMGLLIAVSGAANGASADGVNSQASEAAQVVLAEVGKMPIYAEILFLQAAELSLMKRQLIRDVFQTNNSPAKNLIEIPIDIAEFYFGIRGMGRGSWLMVDNDLSTSRIILTIQKQQKVLNELAEKVSSLKGYSIDKGPAKSIITEIQKASSEFGGEVKGFGYRVSNFRNLLGRAMVVGGILMIGDAFFSMMDTTQNFQLSSLYSDGDTFVQSSLAQVRARKNELWRAAGHPVLERM